MRIATTSIYHSIKTNLNMVSVNMMKANEVVSSGKRINRLSDDPVGLVSVLDLRSSLANIEQLDENITMGKAWLTMGESALTQVGDLLSQTRALCVEMASCTQRASERATAAKVVDGRLEQILSLANTQVGGRYIFSGTESAAAPFSYDGEGTPQTVTYQGNGSPFAIRIAKDIDVEVGRDGEAVFGDGDFDWGDTAAGAHNIFKTLLDLKSSLETDDVAGIQGTLDKLDSHLETVRKAIADTGIKVNRLDAKKSIIQDLTLTYTERMSSLEDADIAEAIMDLESKELAYQAALASSAKVMAMSLVDYL